MKKLLNLLAVVVLTAFTLTSCGKTGCTVQTSSGIVADDNCNGIPDSQETTNPGGTVYNPQGPGTVLGPGTTTNQLAGSDVVIKPDLDPVDGIEDSIDRGYFYSKPDRSYVTRAVNTRYYTGNLQTILAVVKKETAGWISIADILDGTNPAKVGIEYRNWLNNEPPFGFGGRTVLYSTGGFYNGMHGYYYPFPGIDVCYKYTSPVYAMIISYNP